MEEALELASYLPLSFKTPKEQEYIAFLWDAFETNYTHEKYQFAFLAYHMLTMSCVYFNIWQIKHHMRDDFQKATIGFTSRDLEGLIHKDDDDEVKRWAVSPFNFSKAQERGIVRLLALIGCDKAKIGTYAKLIDDRNETAHPNGQIIYSTQTALDIKIAEILRVVEEIQSHSKCVISYCYEQFLLNSYDEEERQYPDAADQIREVLMHPNYFSRKDIDICINFDISGLSDHVCFTSIQDLHGALVSVYKVEEG